VSKAWSVLAKLADKKMQELQAQVREAEAAIEVSLSRQARFTLMIQENVARLNGKGSPVVMADVHVIGNFIQSLSVVLQGLKAEHALLEERKKGLQESIQEAFREVKKMEALLEREQDKKKDELDKKEQKVLNEAGIRRFVQASSK
jgi:flagellar export protein FliJ